MQQPVSPQTSDAVVGLGARIGAGVIDVILLSIVGSIVGLATGGSLVEPSTLGSCLSFIIGIAYWIGMPVWMGGTVGKLVLGAVIVKEDGSPIDYGSSAVRYLLLFVDMIPYFIPYLVGGVLIASSPLKQRLGDRVAKTLVIRKGATVGTPIQPGRF